ncbi:myb-like protein AA [Drosophila eugracilis]|uniref:myb-like protein AA n=1 Tax=Drosophila eugracilis TaxID=29029 RepID=UPI0007E873E1|nr:myb-like protein AA [Drosophila eugracilis]
MQFLRLLVLLGLLLTTQGRVVEDSKTPVVASSPEQTKTVEVKQEDTKETQKDQPQLSTSVNSQDPPANPSSEGIKPVESKQEVATENQEPQSQEPNSVSAQVVQETQPQLVSFISAKPVENVPAVTKEQQETQAHLSNVINPSATIGEKQPTSNDIPKDQELPKEEESHPEAHGRDNQIRFIYEQPGQNQNQYQNQYPQITVQDLDKIFKYQEVQVLNGSQASNQYQNYFNKFQSYPKVEYVSTVNTSDSNVTNHIHNHTHYYPNQKKPGFPFPFLPNPFEKQEQQPIYVNLNQTTNSTGNVTYHTHIHEETKPFPFLPNPFTDFPKVVGLSLVLLPNPFYVNKNPEQVQVVNQTAGGQETVEYQYFGKFRAFSEDSQKQQQQQQQQHQQQPQKPNFYLIPNPLANQVSGDGQKGDANVLLPVNLAALPLLVPAQEFSHAKSSSSSGSISINDLIKATNVHVSQPIKVFANSGLSQVQKEQAAIQQLILSHLSEQQKLFQKQSLAGGKRSQSAEPAAVQGEEESSVLFAVEIPKSIYRFFKGIFGGFSN